MKQKSGYGVFKRSSGSRGTKSYTRNVSDRAAKKRRMVLSLDVKLLLACLVLPPLGIYLVWSKDAARLPVRIGGSIAACIVMYFWFMALIPGSMPSEYQFSKTTPAAVTEYATAQSE